MSETERETAGAVRSAHVAHFIPADWSAIAPRVTGALERIDRALGELQLLIIVPDSSGAVALTRELRALEAAEGAAIVPATSASRAERLLKESAVHALVGSAHTVGELLRASAIKLGSVQGVVFAAADEYDAASDDLALVMAEVPKTGTRLLTATTATPAVEEILERYLHKARRVGGTAEGAAPATAAAATIYARTVSGDAPLAPLGELLDELDPPSTAILTTDDRTTAAAQDAIAALGYAGATSLVTIAEGPVAPNVALVVFAGVPSAATLAETVAAQPGRMVALVTARQRASLERMAGVTVLPWERSKAAREARVREDALRASLRAALAQGIPVREVLALEPLLSDFDGLAIAAAALKLYEREKTRADGLASARPAERAAPQESRAPREASERPRFDREARDARPPRKFDRDGGPPRKFDRESGPPRKFDREERPRTSDRTSDRDSGPRKFDRASGPPRKFERAGAPPRKFDRDGAPAPRGGFTRGARDDRPRAGGDARPASRPFTRGPRRDDGGRPPRKEK